MGSVYWVGTFAALHEGQVPSHNTHWTFRAAKYTNAYVCIVTSATLKSTACYIVNIVNSCRARFITLQFIFGLVSPSSRLLHFQGSRLLYDSIGTGARKTCVPSKLGLHRKNKKKFEGINHNGEEVISKIYSGPTMWWNKLS